MLIPEMPKVRMSELGNSTVPEATYTMRVHKAEYVPVPKNRSAKPYIHAWLVITGPDEQFVGRMVFVNYTLTGGGSYRLRELLSVTGHDQDFELEQPDQLLGLEFRLFTDLSTASRARRPSQKPMFTGENRLLLTHG